MIHKAYQLGVEYEGAYRGCAQCTIAAIHDTLGIPNNDVFKAAAGLSGGVGRAGDGSCGAYIGGAMVLSSLAGRERNDFINSEGKLEEACLLAMSLHDKFIAHYGTVTCRDIHTKIFGRPFYLPDDDEIEKFRAAGAYLDKCTKVVGLAAEWVTQLVLEKGLLKQP